MKWIFNNKDRKQVFFKMHFVLIQLQYNECLRDVGTDTKIWTGTDIEF